MLAAPLPLLASHHPPSVQFRQQRGPQECKVSARGNVDFWRYLSRATA